MHVLLKHFYIYFIHTLHTIYLCDVKSLCSCVVLQLWFACGADPEPIDFKTQMKLKSGFPLPTPVIALGSGLIIQE